MRTATANPPYGYAYQAAVLEAGQIMSLKFGPMAVLQGLVKHINWETGRAFPSKALLASLGGQGLRTVKRHVGTLKASGIIEVVAYETGGYGCATVFKFGLPARSKPRAPKYGAKLAWFDVQRTIYGANLASYGAILASYGANSAHQLFTTDLNKEGIEDPAERGAVLSDAGGVCTVPPWDRVEPFGNYLDRVAAHEREALRAAEN